MSLDVPSHKSSLNTVGHVLVCGFQIDDLNSVHFKESDF